MDARAGTYVVHACALPDGKAVAADGWAPVGGGGKAWLHNTCHDNAAVPPGNLAGGGRGDSPTRMAGFAFTAPADTTVVSFVLDRAARPDLDTSPFTTWYISQSAMSPVPPYRLEHCGMGSGLCSAGKGSFVDRAASNEPCRRSAASALHRSSVSSHSTDKDLDRSTSVAQFAIYRASVELQDELPPVDRCRDRVADSPRDSDRGPCRSDRRGSGCRRRHCHDRASRGRQGRGRAAGQYAEREMHWSRTRLSCHAPRQSRASWRSIRR